MIKPEKLLLILCFLTLLITINMTNVLLVKALAEEESVYEKIMQEYADKKKSDNKKLNEKLNNVQSLSETANILHNYAWLDIAEKAEEDFAYKYALYQSRSIAVKYPEIYLQADALFNRLLTSERNMDEYYQNRTQNLIKQAEEYDKIKKMDGDKFKWSSFSINEHREIGYREIYHTNSFLPYIDIRLHFMGSAFKGANWQATPLSMAEFLYFKYGARDNSFIIMTEKGKAHLYKPSGFLSSEKLVRYDGEEIENVKGKVVLIFNQDFVWYPLMDRDDRNKSKKLNELVHTYASNDNLPQLTKKEKELVKILKENTKLTTEKDKLFALYYAGKLHAHSWSFYPEIFKKLYPRYAEAGFNRSHAPNFITYRNAHIAWLSNLISPITAKMAAVARENIDGSLNQIAGKMIKEYLKYTETRRGHTNLDLWFHSELNYLNIDDNLLSKAANCIYSATNTAAMLDLAAIPNLKIYVIGMKYQKRGGGHAFTAVFKDSVYGVMENGGWSNGFNGLYDKRYYDREGTVISSVTVDNGWINFGITKDFGIQGISTSLSVDEIFNILKEFEERTDSKTRICSKYISKKATEVHSISDFIDRVSQMKINKYKF